MIPESYKALIAFGVLCCIGGLNEWVARKVVWGMMVLAGMAI